MYKLRSQRPSYDNIPLNLSDACMLLQHPYFVHALRHSNERILSGSMNLDQAAVFLKPVVGVSCGCRTINHPNNYQYFIFISFSSNWLRKNAINGVIVYTFVVWYVLVLYRPEGL